MNYHLHINLIKNKSNLYGGHFDSNNKQKRIQELEKKMNESDFWNNQKNSSKIISECNTLKNILKEFNDLKNKIDGNIEMLQLLKENNDIELQQLLEEETKTIEKELDHITTLLLLNKEHDKNDALLEIHPGAGGTESCDWANMLKRMYIRWCENQDFKYEILEELPGEEAGIKSFSMLIHGTYAYGYLKNERGVHRLIRISPFDSGGRRHTSFAAVLVTPYMEENMEIEIKESDIRVDIYRSSGCGGQGVNTTDSAVRITHLPTKIVVTCQNERSQIQNKAKALEVLKNKLYQLELDKQNEKRNETRENESAINFGSQIRTYTMCPYTLVKDHRTNVEVNDVEKVLDGKLEPFINASLKGGI